MPKRGSCLGVAQAKTVSRKGSPSHDGAGLSPAVLSRGRGRVADVAVNGQGCAGRVAGLASGRRARSRLRGTEEGWLVVEGTCRSRLSVV